jgi:hypothetical protein
MLVVRRAGVVLIIAQADRRAPGFDGGTEP